MWIKQLHDRLPVSDTRAHQDANKIMAALEYSADATLNSSRFAAKAIGSSITSCRLLWLRQWHVDSKNKWRLASSPYSGDKLFGCPPGTSPCRIQGQTQGPPSLIQESGTSSLLLLSPLQGTLFCPLSSPVAEVFLPLRGQVYGRLGGFSQKGQNHSFFVGPVVGFSDAPIGGCLTFSPWTPGSGRQSIQASSSSSSPTPITISLMPAFSGSVTEAPDGISNRSSSPNSCHRIGSIRTGGTRLLFAPVHHSEILRGWRAIFDLKLLNCQIVYQRFKMQSLQTILDTIRDKDVLTSIDLMEAYLHVPIYSAYQKILRFCYAARHYQYRALPFGLSLAPRFFTKLMAALAGHL